MDIDAVGRVTGAPHEVDFGVVGASARGHERRSLVAGARDSQHVAQTKVAVVGDRELRVVGVGEGEIKANLFKTRAAVIARARHDDEVAAAVEGIPPRGVVAGRELVISQSLALRGEAQSQQ